MKKNRFIYGKTDQLPDVIHDKDVTVHISLKIEGDLLRSIRGLAEKENLPYQTKLKQMLRAQLASEDNQFTVSRKELKKVVEEIVLSMNRNRKITKKESA